MQTYISILRGINVGGKILKMAGLKTMAESLGFKNVSTYIQSGNLLFQYRSEKPELLEKIIRERIKTDFNLEISTIVLTPEKLGRIIHANPFKDDPTKDSSFMHVTFLRSKQEYYDKDSIHAKKTGKEEIVFTDDAVYLYCPHGYGTSKLNNNLFENKLKVSATTRNWNTTLKLLELAGKVQT